MESGKERLEDGGKRELAQKICSELTVHATIEEEDLLSAVREAFPNQADTLDEAEVEHASAKELISQLEASNPDEDCSMPRSRCSGNMSSITSRKSTQIHPPPVRVGKVHVSGYFDPWVSDELRKIAEDEAPRFRNLSRRVLAGFWSCVQGRVLSHKLAM